MTTTDQITTQPAPDLAGSPARATAYTAFWLFQSPPNRIAITEQERERIGQGMVDAIAESGNDIQLRGAYSTAGLSAGVDLILWLVADSCEPFQRLASTIHRSEAGRMLTMRHVYLGVASMSQYDPDHGAAFLKGIAPRAYLSVYPFTKTTDWYLLPYEQRRDLMIEHGRMGQEFPTILTNTVNSFGIGDQEFIVALEDDNPGTLVKMVQRLRAAEVRKYTQVDTPIFLGLRTDLREAVLGAL